MSVRTLRNFEEASRLEAWSAGTCTFNVGKFSKLANLDAIRFSVEQRGAGAGSYAVLGESLRALTEDRHPVHLNKFFVKELQTRTALINGPLDPHNPDRDGLVDHLGSARGMPLPADPAQAAMLLDEWRRKLRPLVAVMATYEAQRLLGVNQSYCRLVDVDGWLRVTTAEGAAPLNDRKRGR